MKDFYYILGVSEHASDQEIKTAYRKLSLKFHPDKNNGEKFFEERFKQIQEAYKELSNPTSRKQYDEKLHQFNSSKYNRDNLKYKEEELRRKFEEQLRKKEEEIRKNYQNKENKLKEDLFQKQNNSSDFKPSTSKEILNRVIKKTLSLFGIGLIIVTFLMFINSLINNISTYKIKGLKLLDDPIFETINSKNSDTPSMSQIEKGSLVEEKAKPEIQLSKDAETIIDSTYKKTVKHNEANKIKIEKKWQEFYETFKIAVNNKDKDLIIKLTSKDFFDGGGGYDLPEWLDSMIFVNDQNLMQFKAELNKKILDDTDRDGNLLKTTGDYEYGGYLFFVYENNKWLFGGIMGD